jgi:hypothetical protein
MSQKNLDQMVFRENLRRAIVPSLVFFGFTATLVAFSLNVAVSGEEVSGKVLNTIGPVNYEGPVGVSILIELDGGRVVSVSIPPTVFLPKVGQRVTVVRYSKRFFGDSFGLSIKKGAEPFGPAP